MVMFFYLRINCFEGRGKNQLQETYLCAEKFRIKFFVSQLRRELWIYHFKESAAADGEKS